MLCRYTLLPRIDRKNIALFVQPQRKNRIKTVQHHGQETRKSQRLSGPQ